MPDKLAVWLAGLPALTGRTLEADKHRGGNPPAIRAGLNRVHTARAGDYTKESASQLDRGFAAVLFLPSVRSIHKNEAGFVNKLEIMVFFGESPLKAGRNSCIMQKCPGIPG